jgi:hypothetical protein
LFHGGGRSNAATVQERIRLFNSGGRLPRSRVTPVVAARRFSETEVPTTIPRSKCGCRSLLAGDSSIAILSRQSDSGRVASKLASTIGLETTKSSPAIDIRQTELRDRGIGDGGHSPN